MRLSTKRYYGFLYIYLILSDYVTAARYPSSYYKIVNEQDTNSESEDHESENSSSSSRTSTIGNFINDVVSQVSQIPDTYSTISTSVPEPTLLNSNSNNTSNDEDASANQVYDESNGDIYAVNPELNLARDLTTGDIARGLIKSYKDKDLPPGTLWVIDHTAFIGAYSLALVLIGGATSILNPLFCFVTPLGTVATSCVGYIISVAGVSIGTGIGAHHFTCPYPRHGTRFSKSHGAFKIDIRDLINKLEASKASERATVSEAYEKGFEDGLAKGDWSSDYLDRLVEDDSKHNYKELEKQVDKIKEDLAKSKGYDNYDDYHEDQDHEFNDDDQDDGSYDHHEDHEDTDGHLDKRGILTKLKNKVKSKLNSTKSNSTNPITDKISDREALEVIFESVDGPIIFHNFDPKCLISRKNCGKSRLNFNFALFKTRDQVYHYVGDVIPGGEYTDLAVKIAVSLGGKPKARDYINREEVKGGFKKLRQHSIFSMNFREDVYQNYLKMADMDFHPATNSTKMILKQIVGNPKDLSFSYCGKNEDEIAKSTGNHDFLSYFLSVTKMTTTFGHIGGAPTDCVTTYQKVRKVASNIHQGTKNVKESVKNGAKYAFDSNTTVAKSGFEIFEDADDSFEEVYGYDLSDDSYAFYDDVESFAQMFPLED